MKILIYAFRYEVFVGGRRGAWVGKHLLGVIGRSARVRAKLRRRSGQQMKKSS